MPSPYAAWLEVLDSGTRYSFADWPNPDLPRVAAGVYTVWLDRQLLYAGMAGQGLTAEQVALRRNEGASVRGLFDRLRSHRTGRRGGDQFCLYVFDRFVLPVLTADEIARVRIGRLSLDTRTGEFIRQHLSYRFVEVPDGATALTLEREVRRGALAAGPPFLNPLN